MYMFRSLELQPQINNLKIMWPFRDEHHTLIAILKVHLPCTLRRFSTPAVNHSNTLLLLMPIMSASIKIICCRQIFVAEMIDPLFHFRFSVCCQKVTTFVLHLELKSKTPDFVVLKQKKGKETHFGRTGTALKIILFIICWWVLSHQHFGPSYLKRQAPSQ